MPTAGHAHRAEVGGSIYLRDLQGVHWFTQKFALYFLGDGSDSYGKMPCVLALAGQPSLHGYYACMVCWANGAQELTCLPNNLLLRFSMWEVGYAWRFGPGGSPLSF